MSKKSNIFNLNVSPNGEVEEAVLHEVLTTDSVVPVWTVSEYCLIYVDALDVWHFKIMCADGQNAAILDRSCLRRNSDFSAQNCSWTSLLCRCAGIVILVDLFIIPFVRHSDRVGSLCNSRLVLDRVKSVGAFSSLALCCLPEEFDKFYLIKEVSGQGYEFDSEQCQRVNARGISFVEWYNLELFALRPRERDLL